jgi:hypothetical protein
MTFGSPPTPVSLSSVAAGSSDGANSDSKANVASALTATTASAPTVHQHWHCRVHICLDVVGTSACSSSSSSPPVDVLIAAGSVPFALSVSSSEDARCHPRLPILCVLTRSLRNNAKTYSSCALYWHYRAHHEKGAQVIRKPGTPRLH